MQSTPRRRAIKKWAADTGEHGSFSLVIPLGIDHEYLAAVVDALPISAIVLRTAPDFSPSSQNRDRVRAALSAGGPMRVWEPQGLWELDQAAALARECGALIALDALAADPLNENADTLAEQIAGGRIYVRLSGMGSARKRFKEYDLSRLAQLVDGLEQAWIAFGNPASYKDAQAFEKLVRGH